MKTRAAMKWSVVRIRKPRNRGGEEKPVRIQRLTWNDNANRRRVWRADFPLDARGCRVGIDRFFIWEPGGELKLLRFPVGGKRGAEEPKPAFQFQTKIKLPSRSKSIIELVVREFESCYLVIFVRRRHGTAKFRTSVGVRLRYIHSNRKIYDADVLAIDKESGHMLWDGPGGLEVCAMSSEYARHVSGRFVYPEG